MANTPKQLAISTTNVVISSQTTIFTASKKTLLRKLRVFASSSGSLNLFINGVQMGSYADPGTSATVPLDDSALNGNSFDIDLGDILNKGDTFGISNTGGSSNWILSGVEID